MYLNKKKKKINADQVNQKIKSNTLTHFSGVKLCAELELFWEKPI